ncbi:hypothetical protein LCGC14_0384610, partial [marine sediment metagenome]
PAEDVAVTIKNLLEGLGGGSQLSHDQLDDVSVDDHHAQSHNIASHSDTTATGTELDALTDNSMADTLHRHSELSASDGSPDRIVYTNSEGVLFADALGTGASSGLGLDVMYGATIGTHLTVGNDITVGGTVDGVDIAVRDHAESHSVASHNDTTATGANLNTLVGGSETALHSHAAAGGAALTVAETEVFSGTAPTTWTDLNLSGTIGAQSSLVLLKFASIGAGYNRTVAVRKNGDTDEFYGATANEARGVALGQLLGASVVFVVLLVATDATGKIEWKSAAITMTVDVIAYIK